MGALPTMYLTHTCRPRPIFYKNALQLSRSLSGGASSPGSDPKPRQAPRALDFGGILLDNSGETGDNPRGYIPNLKDLGQGTSHIEQLLSARLRRRLPPEGATAPAPKQRSTPDRYEQRPQRSLQATGPRFPRPRTGLAGGNKSGGAAQAPPRRTPRSGGAVVRTNAARVSDAEPEVPVTPAAIPVRVCNLTNHHVLTAPVRAASRGDRSADLAQRVHETVGGDYSGWFSKGDVAAAGKDEDVSTIARARLALAFNFTISPKDRGRLLSTVQMLLNKGKPASIAAPLV